MIWLWSWRHECEGFDDDIIEEVSEPEPEGRGVTLDDFVAYMPVHSYIFTPCREVWAGAIVNARLPRVPVLDRHGQPKARRQGQAVTIAPTLWLDRTGRWSR